MPISQVCNPCGGVDVDVILAPPGKRGPAGPEGPTGPSGTGGLTGPTGPSGSGGFIYLTTNFTPNNATYPQIVPNATPQLVGSVVYDPADGALDESFITFQATDTAIYTGTFNIFELGSPGGTLGTTVFTTNGSTTDRQIATISTFSSNPSTVTTLELRGLVDSGETGDKTVDVIAWSVKLS